MSGLTAPFSRQTANRLLWLPDKVRSMGIHIVGTKGMGKSRLMGRIISWFDLIRGVPLVVLDPNGPTIHNLLDKIARLPSKEKELLLERIIYVDMSGSRGHIVPFPLYYRQSPEESLYRISQRYLEAIRRVDPWLSHAPIQGWNAVVRLGTFAGMIVSALDLQVTEIEDLFNQPETWVQRFRQAVSAYPEVAPAVEFFETQYARWRPSERDMRTDSLRNKIASLTLDSSSRAMFGGRQPGINWTRMVEKRQAILLDFSQETSADLRRFKMLWVFLSFLEFVKARGAGRHQPISFIIDELTALYNLEVKGSDVFSTDMNELINIIARNYSIWLTLAHQEMFQVDENTQKTLMTMGTQIIGGTSDPGSATYLARVFSRYNPYAVKRYEPVYRTRPDGIEVIDQRPIDYTLDEQVALASTLIRDQGSFRFLVRPALAEGDARGQLSPVSIARLDQGQWVDEKSVQELQEQLIQKTGQPLDTVLNDINSRLLPSQTVPSATLEEYEDPNNLPVSGTGEDFDDLEEFREQA